MSIHRPLLVIGLLTILALSSLCQSDRPAQLSPATDYADYPSMAATSGGDVYVAWVAYDGRGSDEIRMRRFSGGNWEEPVTVTRSAGDYFKAEIAVDSEDRLWVTWAARESGNVDIYARVLSDGKWSRVTRVTSHPEPDFHHRLAAGADGSLYLCWQSFRTGDANIYLKKYADGKWSEPIAVTTHEASDWEPAIALDGSGRLNIVYDTYRHGDYDVFLRVYERGELSPEIPVAASPNFEARATVTCDSAGRVWIAWDDQGPGWGLDRPFWNLSSQRGDWGPPAPWVGDTPGVAQSISLRRVQSIGVAVSHEGGIWKPASDINTAIPAAIRGSIEIPHLATDANGTPWLFFRKWVARNDGSSMAVRPGGWDIYATHYTGAEWSDPVRLDQSTGSNDQRVAIATGPGRKLWVAYPADDRLDNNGAIKTIDKRHGKVYLTTLNAAAGGSPKLDQSEKPESRPFAHTAFVGRRNTTAAGEKRYQLYWGDLHRHTEISGDGGYDGTVWDMYRYALDVAELDFIATTDHYYGGFGDKDSGRTYDWWRTQKMTDLFLVSGKFAPLFGYGRSLKWPYGHRNIINLKRGYTAFDETIAPAAYDEGAPREADEEKLWSAVRGQDVITIPHTIASGAGTDWTFNDPALEPLMEIYQGCRLSYEAPGAPRTGGRISREAGVAWNALAKGYKVGFIASSDHRSTHVSYAAVYAEEPTREAIFRALQQRHAYAATDNIVVDVRMGDAIMGDMVETKEPPVLQVMVRGTAPIREIQIIKNNVYVYHLQPGKQEVSFTFRDNDATPGESYYYLRLQQEDAQMAWVSPIWVNYNPD